MNELGRILPRLLLRANDSEESRRQAVFAAWGWAAGDMVRQQTAPVKFEGKKLVVATSGEPWKAQLKIVDKQLIFKINSILGSPVVRTLDFVLNPEEVDRFHQHPAQAVIFSAPEAQSRQFEPRVAPIKDANLREQFLRAAGKCLDRRAK